MIVARRGRTMTGGLERSWGGPEAREVSHRIVTRSVGVVDGVVVEDSVDISDTFVAKRSESPMR